MGKTVRTGVQKEYLQGLDNLRNLVVDVELELDKAKREFYDSDENSEEAYETYLKERNDNLLYCNNKLRKAGSELHVIDSELKLVELLNNVRELDDNIDMDVVSDLTEFWEHIKDCLQSIQAVCMKFQKTVLHRLQSGCLSYRDPEAKFDLSETYANDVNDYQKRIEELMKNIHALVKSFTSEIKQELFTNTNFSERVLIMCDQKAFPILRIFPDITEKVALICSLSKQWIDKDETYIYDIGAQIRQARTETRKKEEDLRQQQQKQEELNKATNDALVLFSSHKKQLKKIEHSLKVLETQVHQCSQEKKFRIDEKRSKETMVGFLEISIGQTKKNYTLQLKRSRILRQLKELEQSLKDIEEELVKLEPEVSQKAQEKAEIADKVENYNTTYKNLKTDLNKVTENLEKVQNEIEEMSETMTQLEIIQNFKTSPERIEDFYDAPASVKLAPSLMEKIKARKRKILNNLNSRH